MRFLGVDLGTKRIGLAVLDDSVQAVRVLKPLQAHGKLALDAEAVHRVARSEEVQQLVVGLPLDPDGTEGRMARVMRIFGGHLAERGWEVHFQDETLTSVEAEASIKRLDLTVAETRQRKDGEAAALILERFSRG